MATDLFLPADGLRLLGQHGGGGYDGRRFLVGRSDGEVIQLPLLPYLIMAAIAEGGVDGGWSADQIGDRVGTASGQGLTADTVRDLVAGTLAPLGLVAPDGADRPADAAGPKQPPGRMKPPYRRRRWGLAVGGAAVLVCVAATAPIMAETGTGETGRTSPASGSASASTSASASARLLAILSLLSAQLPVRLVAFIGAPGAGSGVPLRGAEIGVASPSARSAVVGLLDAQQGLYRPAAVTVIGGSSQAVVAVRFDAPADLNISQP